MAHNRQNKDKAPREFFTLGEHTLGNRSYRFRYDGKVYHILEKRGEEEEEAGERERRKKRGTGERMGECD